MDAVTLRAEGKVGFLVALPLLYPFLGIPALPNSTKEEPDYALRALMLLVYALFWAVLKGVLEYLFSVLGLCWAVL